MGKIRVGCAVMVENGDKLLLGRRGKEPNYGLMIIPGGGVEFLEPMRQTAMREVKEETGIDVVVDRQLGVYEIINPPEEHRVIIYWKAKYTTGEIKASSDLLDAAFYSKGEIKALDNNNQFTETVRKVLIDFGWLS